MMMRGLRYLTQTEREKQMKEIIKNEIIKSIEINNNKEKAMSNNEVNGNVNNKDNTMSINLEVIDALRQAVTINCFENQKCHFASIENGLPICGCKDDQHDCKRILNTLHKYYPSVEYDKPFRVADTLKSYYETRYGWSGSIVEETDAGMVVACLRDALMHGLYFVEVEFYVENFDEIVSFLTFCPKDGRNRVSVEKLLFNPDDFYCFYTGIKTYLSDDLKSINDITDESYKTIGYNCDARNEAAFEAAKELEEIVASFMRVVVNDSQNEEDKMRVVRNCTKEDCLVDRYRNKIESLRK